MDKGLLDEVEAFTCTCKEDKFVHVDDLRFYMLNEKCKNETISSNTNIDLSVLPPCRKSFVQYARCANFLTAIWKRAHVPAPDIPEANDGHGRHVCDGTLQPLWTEEEVELTLLEAVINDIIIESDSTEDQESNVPSDYDSDTDFYDYENDSGSEEDEYVWEFRYPCILKDVYVLVLMKNLQETL